MYQDPTFKRTVQEVSIQIYPKRVSDFKDFLNLEWHSGQIEINSF